jgi:hypothetical protein
LVNRLEIQMRLLRKVNTKQAMKYSRQLPMQSILEIMISGKKGNKCFVILIDHLCVILTYAVDDVLTSIHL